MKKEPSVLRRLVAEARVLTIRATRVGVHLVLRVVVARAPLSARPIRAVLITRSFADCERYGSVIDELEGGSRGFRECAEVPAQNELAALHFDEPVILRDTFEAESARRCADTVGDPERRLLTPLRARPVHHERGDESVTLGGLVNVPTVRVNQADVVVSAFVQTSYNLEVRRRSRHEHLMRCVRSDCEGRLRFALDLEPHILFERHRFNTVIPVGSAILNPEVLLLASRNARETVALEARHGTAAVGVAVAVAGAAPEDQGVGGVSLRSLQIRGVDRE